jgi:hypothetical protein
MYSFFNRKGKRVQDIIKNKSFTIWLWGFLANVSGERLQVSFLSFPPGVGPYGPEAESPGPGHF